MMNPSASWPRSAMSWQISRTRGELARAGQVRQEEAGRVKPGETKPAELPQEEVVKLRPDENNPVKPEPVNPDTGVLAAVRESENSEGREQVAAERNPE